MFGVGAEIRGWSVFGRGTTHAGNIKKVEATVAEEVEGWVLADLETVLEAYFSDIAAPKCTTG